MDKPSAPSDIANLFAKLGGTGAAARAMDVGQSTASEMKRRRSIPVTYWPSLIRAAASKGFALDEAALVALHIAAAPETAPEPAGATS